MITDNAWKRKKTISQTANGTSRRCKYGRPWHDHMSLIYGLERKDGYDLGKTMSAC